MPYIELVNARQVELEAMHKTIEYRRQWSTLHNLERMQAAIRKATRRARAEEFRAAAFTGR